MKIKRNAGDRNLHDITLEKSLAIIVDHTKKYTVVENWLFERGDLSAYDKLIYIVPKSRRSISHKG